MNKLTSLEKTLINQGLEEMIDLYKRDNERLINEGKIPMIRHEFITQTVEDIKSKLNITNNIEYH
jgi:hypothetical protein